MSKIAGYNTISKSRFPVGPDIPKNITYGYGSVLWDENGKAYIDWTASLGTIIRGYYPNTVRRSSSLHCLPMITEAEEELAELLCKVLPSAELVRFFKTGSDACSAAVRLARHLSRRDNIMSSGYHGWHDSFCCLYGRPPYGNSCHRGIVDDQTNTYWNISGFYWDPITIEYLVNAKPACFIIEPMDRRNPEACTKERLQKIRDICTENNIILIFDEILTAFRVRMGGIAELYGITPDLMCVGKAMSNGYPITALVGKAEYMQHMKDIYVTGTYYSDHLSCIKTIENINSLNAWDFSELFKCFDKFKFHCAEIIAKNDLQDIVYVKSFGPWMAFEWSDKTAQHYFIQEVIKRGILFNRDHFCMLSHKEYHVDNTLEVYYNVFKEIKENRNNLKDKINTEIQL